MLKQSGAVATRRHMLSQLCTTWDNVGHNAFWGASSLWTACSHFYLADANWHEKPVRLLLLGQRVSERRPPAGRSHEVHAGETETSETKGGNERQQRVKNVLRRSSGATRRSCALTSQRC